MRLIDADAVEKVLTDMYIKRPLDSDRWLIVDIESGIRNLPSIAEVPVVRCKDCVCWDTSWKPTRAIEGAYWCSSNDIYMEPDDYCSLGERKES